MQLSAGFTVGHVGVAYNTRSSKWSWATGTFRAFIARHAGLGWELVGFRSEPDSPDTNVRLLFT